METGKSSWKMIGKKKGDLALKWKILLENSHIGKVFLLEQHFFRQHFLSNLKIAGYCRDYCNYYLNDEYGGGFSMDSDSDSEFVDEVESEDFLDMHDLEKHP